MLVVLRVWPRHLLAYVLLAPITLDPSACEEIELEAATLAPKVEFRSRARRALIVTCEGNYVVVIRQGRLPLYVVLAPSAACHRWLSLHLDH